MIELWCNIIDSLLPFEWLQHAFMKNALLAILLVTPIFGILGTMVVNNRMAFFADSLGHSVLTGVAVGVILGIRNPLWSMIIFSLLFTLAILVVKSANSASTDTIIGVFSSIAVALGIVVLSKHGFNRYTNYLIGDILSITSSEILLLFVVLMLVVLAWIFIFNKLLVVSINQSLAGSRGINVRVVEIIFASLVAVIVTVSIQWVGLLIINSLLVLPAAAARNISRNARQYNVISLLIAMISGVTGLIVSYYWGTATGATIILISGIFFFITLALRSRFG
jgi:zinc transport system permease protein